MIELLTQQPPPVGVLRVLGDKAVIATRLVVRREGRDLGQVLILRDRSHAVLSDAPAEAAEE